MSDVRKFQHFGVELKKIRQGAKKSLDDVSEAVELPTTELQRIEHGAVRPKQALILLLAAYFNLSRPKTTQLLNLAGYKSPEKSSASSLPWQKALQQLAGQHGSGIQQILLAFSETASEDKVLYTDATSVNVSPSGVVIEFAQRSSTEKQEKPRIAARVGMSVNHAYRFKEILQQALTELESKRDSN